MFYNIFSLYSFVKIIIKIGFIMNVQSNKNDPNDLKLSGSIPVEQVNNMVSIDLISSKIPHVESNLYGPVLGKHVINNKVIFLEEEGDKIDRMIDQAFLLDKEKTKETQDIIDQAADLTVEKILSSEEIPVDIESEIISFLEKDELFEKKIMKSTPEIEMLNKGSVVIVSLLLLNCMKKIIKVKEERYNLIEETKDPVLEREILLLKNWVKVQSIVTNENIQKLGLESVFSSPQGVTTILNLANASSAIFSSVLGWVGIGLSIISQVRSLRKNQQDFNKHVVWTEIIKNSGMIGNDAKKVYDEQKLIFKNRLELNLRTLNSFLSPIIEELQSAEDYPLEDQKKVLLETKIKLKDVGIEVPLDHEATVETLYSYLSNSLNHENLNKMMVQKKETLSVSLRNGLRTLANRKEKIDKGFLKFSLNKTRIVFTATMVVTAVTIAIKVLSIVGVISAVAASAALAATGFGILALGITCTILGAVYLYIKKPNIFKTYLQGIQLKLLFWRIPLAIHTHRRNYTLMQEHKISVEINLIAGRILEIDKLLKTDNKEEIKNYLRKINKKISGNVEEILENYKQGLIKTQISKEAEFEIRNKKLNDLNLSVAKFSEKVETLQEKINNAGWKDFERLLNKKKYKEDKASSEKLLISNKNDEVKILVEHLLKDSTLLEDSETKKILNHMDVDITKLNKKDLEAVKEGAEKSLRVFFAMDVDDTLYLIKKQTIMGEHGLR